MIALHWLMAIAMITAFVLAQVMDDMPRGPAKVTVMGWHVLFGLSIAVLIIARLLARWTGAPPLPRNMPPMEAMLAKLAHIVLYAAMLIMPVTGLVAVTTGNRDFSVLGLFTLPSLAPTDWLHEGMEEIHETVAMIFLFTLVLHVFAVLWHAVIRRDGLAARMIPFLSR